MKSVDEIINLAKDMSASDRSRIMAEISYPSSRKSVVSKIQFLKTRGGMSPDAIRLDFEDGRRAFVRKGRLIDLALSFDHSIECLGEAEAMELLVGKHIIVDEHATPKGVMVAIRRDYEHHPAASRPASSAR